LQERRETRKQPEREGREAIEREGDCGSYVLMRDAKKMMNNAFSIF